MEDSGLGSWKMFSEAHSAIKTQKYEHRNSMRHKLHLVREEPMIKFAKN